MTPIKRAVHAAWDELERQGAYIDRDTMIIDGHVDMAALVRTVFQAIREPSEAMVDAGDDTQTDYEAGLTDLTSAKVWPAMIDAALVAQE